jgi:hypothetical protein
MVRAIDSPRLVDTMRFCLQAARALPAANGMTMESGGLSAERVNGAEVAMRLDLLERAIDRAARMSQSSGHHWRVGDIQFGAACLVQFIRRRKGEERITLVAQVTLNAFTRRHGDRPSGEAAQEAA